MKEGLGIDWMPRDMLTQAIPPVYAEWIARQALQLLDRPDSPPKPLKIAQNP